MTVHPDQAALDRLKTRIQGLRSKTTYNGCTEAEALLAAAKVAELLDRYDLWLTDVRIRTAQCEQRHYETRRELIDNAVRSELGRYKSSAGYQGFRYQDRHLANSSFTLGMVVSIADKLTATKRERDAVKNGAGRDLVFLKASVVDAELPKLNLRLPTVALPGATRIVSPAGRIESDFDRQLYRITLVGQPLVGVDGRPSMAIEGLPILSAAEELRIMAAE